MSEAKYDAERFLDDVFAIMLANLNTQITKIQAEKAILLGSNNFDVALIDADCWFDSLDQRVANCDPYVYYGINDNSVIEIASAESSDLTAFFLVVAAYDGSDKEFRKMLRYIRAMQQVASKHFRDIPEASNLKVSSIQPSDVRDIEEDGFHKIGGVSIQAAIS